MDSTTTTWTVVNARSGVTLGCYEGADENAALDAMARDAGYPDYAAACAVAPVADDEIVVQAVRS